MANMNHDRVLEALSDLVPEGARDKVAKIVTSLLDEAVADIQSKFESEYNSKLDEGYRIIAEEREKDWQTAQTGYRQAYDIIADLRARLARQDEEFKSAITEEYEKAYQMILAERAKNENIHDTLYEDFNRKTEGIKEFIVEKADEFLAKMAGEYYEMARREVLNDPCMAEHRVAFEKVIDVVKDYISDEDVMLNTNSKVEELAQKLESVEVVKRQLEAKNMRLMTENNKIHEYLKETKELIEKNLINEQNERLVQARNVQGRGFTVAEPEREVLLGETVNSNTASETVNDDEPTTIAEQWQVLAGLKDRS